MKVKNVLQSVSVLGRAAARRAVQGPLVPGWPVSQELAVTWMQHEFRKPLVSPARARAALDKTATLELRRERLRRQEISVAGRPALHVSPKERRTDRVVLYLHGGGYITGSPVSHLLALTEVAMATGAEVIGLDYRLAPEHPCPAAIEDAVAAFLELRRAGPVVLAGDSAGGGLALATLIALRDGGHPTAPRAALLSPWVDLGLSFPSIQANIPTDYLSPPNLQVAASMYLGGRSPTDPMASPLFADLHDLPPLYIAAGGRELFCDEILALAVRAKEAGVRVHLDHQQSEIHVWPMFMGASPNAPLTWRAIGDWLTEEDA